jgi:hypothetical protein
MVWLAENMAMALKNWKTPILARKFQKFARQEQGAMKAPCSCFN